MVGKKTVARIINLILSEIEPDFIADIISNNKIGEEAILLGQAFKYDILFKVITNKFNKDLYKWDGKSMTDGWYPTYNNPDNSGCDIEAEPIMPKFIITSCNTEVDLNEISSYNNICIKINSDIIDWEFNIASDSIPNVVLPKFELDDLECDYNIQNDGTLLELVENVKTELFKFYKF